MSDNGFPSMTALLGLLAVAGFQNRDKLAEWFGGAQGGQSPQGVPDGLDKAVGSSVATQSGGIGGLLGGGIQELIERFKQGGHGDTADSWVKSGPNNPISSPDLEKTIGSDVLSELENRTGISRAELLERLSKTLPDAVDRYTPDGRVTA